jgi:hypothetical protein
MRQKCKFRKFRITPETAIFRKIAAEDPEGTEERKIRSEEDFFSHEGTRRNTKEEKKICVICVICGFPASRPFAFFTTL